MVFSNPVIAHRGAWKHTGYAENSIEALKAAMEMGCGGVELDIWLSADEQLVVHHDADFQGRLIEEIDAPELLPRLDAFLEADIPLVIEIKPPRRRDLIVRKLLELVNRRDIVCISFDIDVLTGIRRLAPDAHLQYLLGDLSPAALHAKGINGLDYHYSVYQQNPHWVSEAKALHMSLNAWTVNEVEVMKACLDAGFGMITTDEPALCLGSLPTALTVC